MLGSERFEHVLHQYVAPHKETRTLKDVITLNVHQDGNVSFDGFHKGGRVFEKLVLKPGERAIVLSLKMLYCQNGSAQEVVLHLKDLFGTRPGKSGHPEVSGVIHVRIPGGFCGSVPASSQMLYEANFLNLGTPIIHYAGMEDAILSARSSAITPDSQSLSSDANGVDFQIFQATDPLMVFILRHMPQWSKRYKIQPHDVMQCKGDASHFYKVKRHVVERATLFFKETVFPLFCYTQRCHTPTISLAEPCLKQELLQVDSGLAVVLVELELEYVFIQAGISKFAIKETRIS